MKHVFERIYGGKIMLEKAHLFIRRQGTRV